MGCQPRLPHCGQLSLVPSKGCCGCGSSARRGPPAWPQKQHHAPAAVPAPGADRQGSLRAAPARRASRGSSRLYPVLRSDIQVAAVHHPHVPPAYGHLSLPRPRGGSSSPASPPYLSETLSPSAPLPTLSEDAVCVLLGLTLNIGTLNVVIVVSLCSERGKNEYDGKPRVLTPAGPRDPRRYRTTHDQSQNTSVAGPGLHRPPGRPPPAPSFLRERPAPGA